MLFVLVLVLFEVVVLVPVLLLLISDLVVKLIEQFPVDFTEMSPLIFPWLLILLPWIQSIIATLGYWY